MSKNIIFFGPPGSGKGTQIDLLKHSLDYEIISSGDIVRKLAQNNQNVQAQLESGELVKDEILFGAIEKKIKETPSSVGVVFDGFPRNIRQAEALEKMLANCHRYLDRVIYIYLSEQEVIARLTIRRVCDRCGKPLYGLENCTCGGKATIRRDDSPEVIKNRYKVFLDETRPLVSYYEKKNTLLRINGDQSIDDVSKEIKRGLGL